MTGAARAPFLVGVAAASAFGGVLAVLAVALRREITRPGVVAGTVLVVTVLCLLTALTVTATSEPPAAPDQRDPRPTDGPVRPRPLDPRPHPVQPGQRLVPATRVAPSPAPSPGPGPRSVEIPLRKPPDGRKPVRQRAQCPRCGDFALAVQQLRHQLGFSCLACGHTWYWAPDQPWPVTVVRPGLAAARPAAPVGPPSFRLKA